LDAEAVRVGEVGSRRGLGQLAKPHSRRAGLPRGETRTGLGAVSGIPATDTRTARRRRTGCRRKRSSGRMHWSAGEAPSRRGGCGGPKRRSDEKFLRVVGGKKAEAVEALPRLGRQGSGVDAPYFRPSAGKASPMLAISRST